MTGTLALALLLSGPAAPAGIRWERRFDEALKKARLLKKPLIVDFWADWCSWCHRLDKSTYVDPVVARAAEDFVAVKVNTEGGARETQIALRYDVSSLPTILFLTPSGRQLSRVNGFQGPGQFPSTLQRAKEEAQKVMAWEAALEKNPKDAPALALLGTHLFEQEFYEESRDLLHEAARLDAGQPVGNRRRTRMLLAIIQNYDRRYGQAETLLKEALALKPPGDDEPKLLFILGRTYVSWGRPAEARQAMQQIVDDFAQSPLAQKARETLVVLDHK